MPRGRSGEERGAERCPWTVFPECPGAWQAQKGAEAKKRVCRPWRHAEHNVNHTMGTDARIQWTELCTSGRCRRGGSSPHTPATGLVCNGQGRDVADALWTRVADVQLPREHTVGRSSSPGFSLNIHHLSAWFIHKLGFPLIFLQRPH